MAVKTAKQKASTAPKKTTGKKPAAAKPKETMEEEPTESPDQPDPQPTKGRRAAKRKADPEPAEPVKTTTTTSKKTRKPKETTPEAEPVETETEPMETEIETKPKNKRKDAPPSTPVKNEPTTSKSSNKKVKFEAKTEPETEPKQSTSRRGRPPSKSVKAPVFLLDIPTVPGNTQTLSAGDGDLGQLGIGEGAENGKSRFVAVSEIPEKIVRCAAGGMHSLLLSESGKVYSFGCNDDGSLGRVTEEEEECYDPKVAQLSTPAAKVVAGNVHSVALTSDGRVYIWGSYRDNNGPLGIKPETEKPSIIPEHLDLPEKIKDVACGLEHTIFLGVSGMIYTIGCSEQGRLGRIKSSHCCRTNRRARQTMLNPKMAPARKRKVILFDRVWAGRFCTFARSVDGAIWGCGLNNAAQLGDLPPEAMEDEFYAFKLTELTAFDPTIKWEQISGGETHTLALDSEGTVYSLGRRLYGRLGLSEPVSENGKPDDKGDEDVEKPNGEKKKPQLPEDDVKKPTIIPGLEKKCTKISAGDHTSFALDREGRLYSWGQGSNMLGHGDRTGDDAVLDVFLPEMVKSKALKDRKVIDVSAGGNHALCIVSKEDD